MDSTVPKREDAIDPFAEDVFSDARKSKKLDSSSTKLEIEENSEWFQNLPKATAANDWNDLLNNLPSEFSGEMPGRLAKSLAEFLTLSDKNSIEFVFLVNREIREIEELSIEDQKSWWLTLGIENSVAQIALEMTNVFAAWLVDAALGIEHPSPGREIRRLTPTELSVIEFLTRSLLLEANRDLGSAVFEFRSISSKLPVWFESDLSPENAEQSLLQLNFQIVHELLPSIVKIYVSPESLGSLQQKNKRVLGNRSASSLIKSLKTSVTDIPVRLLFGSSQLSVNEIGSLEIDDVVLIENVGVFAKNGKLSGRMEAFIGASNGVSIKGKLREASVAFDEDQTIEHKQEPGNKFNVQPINIQEPWQFLIKDLSGRKRRLKRKKFMSEEENNSANEKEEPQEQSIETKGGLAVEKIAVNLRVELDARRLTLEELSNLRENQVLELAIAQNDAVNLIVDDQSIGRGELVSVNDRLGVRITKLLR